MAYPEARDGSTHYKYPEGFKGNTFASELLNLVSDKEFMRQPGIQAMMQAAFELTLSRVRIINQWPSQIQTELSMRAISGYIEKTSHLALISGNPQFTEVMRSVEDNCELAFEYGRKKSPAIIEAFMTECGGILNKSLDHGY